MSTILFECDVTEFNTKPPKENDVNTFALTDKSIIISFMQTKHEKILFQSEICREDAIELANLILMKYKL